MAIGVKVMHRPERENSYLRAALKGLDEVGIALRLEFGHGADVPG